MIDIAFIEEHELQRTRTLQMELRRYANVVICPSLRDAPEDSIILYDGRRDADFALDELAFDKRAGVAPRLIPIGVSRTHVFKLLERLSLPGAVDDLSLTEWTANPHARGARGVFGLRVVGESIGAHAEYYESGPYCYLASETHRGLPDLLVAYAAAIIERR